MKRENEQGDSKTELSDMEKQQEVLNTIKRVCTSPVALVAIIAYTAAVILRLLDFISGFSSIWSYIDGTSFLSDTESLFSDFYTVIEKMIAVIGIIGLVSAILTAVGLWITYSSARNPRMAGMKTTGLTLIKVILVTSLVYISVAVVAIVTILFIAEINLSDRYTDLMMTVLGIIVVTAMAISLTLGILYYVKAIQTVNRLKNTIVSGIPSDKVSVLVAVSSLIVGGYTVIFIPKSLGVMAVFTNLCSAAAFIAFGIFLFFYRNKMRLLMQEQG